MKKKKFDFKIYLHNIYITNKINIYMSLLVKSSDLTNEQIQTINNDLIIKIPSNKYNKSAPVKEISTYFLDDNNKFVGAYRGRRFRDVSKIKFRNDKLIELGI